MVLDIDKIAELARLKLKPEERGKLQKDLDAILAYVEKLNQVKTENVEPMNHVMNAENVMRQDKVETSDIREEVLKHAPERDGNFFKVPKVVDKG